ncbi:hypothetical protein HDF11_003214 [Tunturiibacter psychrotolerans]
MPKFDSHPFDPAPEVSNPALNGSADRLTAVPSHKPHEIRQSRDVPQRGITATWEFVIIYQPSKT